MEAISQELQCPVKKVKVLYKFTIETVLQYYGTKVVQYSV